MMRDAVPQVTNVYNAGPTPTPQKVDYTVASAASADAIAANAVLLVSTTACFIVFGATPTATSAGFFLPANVFVALECDSANKVAAIRLTNDGSLYVTPLY